MQPEWHGKARELCRSHRAEFATDSGTDLRALSREVTQYRYWVSRREWERERYAMKSSMIRWNEKECSSSSAGRMISSQAVASAGQLRTYQSRRRG